MPTLFPVELAPRPVLLVGVIAWAMAVPSYSHHHPGLTAAVVGALGFTWGLVTLGHLASKLR